MGQGWKKTMLSAVRLVSNRSTVRYAVNNHHVNVIAIFKNYLFKN